MLVAGSVVAMGYRITGAVTNDNFGIVGFTIGIVNRLNNVIVGNEYRWFINGINH
tara:strand:- start:316 stop:480 length:165 start_codon:yes stop_codon:yes gene_type:complete